MALVVAIPFLVIVTAFVVLGTASTSRAIGTAFSSWLNGLGRLGTFIVGPISELGISLARWITHNVGAEWADLQRLAVTWLGGIAQWAELVIGNALRWPEYLLRFQEWLLFVELPKIIRAIPHAATSVVHSVTTRVIRVERTITKLPKLSRALAKELVAGAVATYVHPFLGQLAWLRRNFAALTHALPHALPIPTVPAIPNIWKRLRALERKIGVPVALGVVAAALARLGVGWIRCNKVRRLGKAVCGMDDSLLESILSDALTIFGILSVVEFAEGLRAIEDEAIGIMGAFVREWPS